MWFKQKSVLLEQCSHTIAADVYTLVLDGIVKLAKAIMRVCPPNDFYQLYDGVIPDVIL
jgi:hypothetical protein